MNHAPLNRSSTDFARLNIRLLDCAKHAKLFHMRSLGQELQTARKFKKLSLREVEAATGISNPYLSQLENDKIQKPSPQFLGKLASLYDLDFQIVMEAAGYVSKTNRTEGPKTILGDILFSQNLSASEERQLVDYLSFIRSKKPE
jgi:transcriptional regulator with XRE-family HTH domain